MESEAFTLCVELPDGAPEATFEMGGVNVMLYPEVVVVYADRVVEVRHAGRKPPV
jgi:hypothetical protein